MLIDIQADGVWQFGGTLYYKNVDELTGSGEFYAWVTGDEERANIIFSKSTLPKDIFAFVSFGFTQRIDSS